jgi:hypothetical protein
MSAGMAGAQNSVFFILEPSLDVVMAKHSEFSETEHSLSNLQPEQTKQKPDFY